MANNWADGQTIIETSSNYLAYWEDRMSVVRLSYVAAGGETITIDKWFKELSRPIPHKVEIVNY